MKFILILLLAFSTIKIEANEHENAQQWESICKDFEKDTIAGAGYDNGFCTPDELSKKHVHHKRLINTYDFRKIKKNCYQQFDLEQNQNNQVVIDLILAHKYKILSLLGISLSIAIIYHILNANK
jgi:hypothetical protein